MTGEELFFDSEDIFRKLLDTSPDAVFCIQGVIFVYVNKQGANLLGYDTPDELIGKDAMSFVHPDYRQVVRERTLARQNRENPLNRYEVKLLKRDGSSLDVEFNISTLEIENVLYNITYARDISERIRYRERIAALHKHAAELIKANDLDTIIVKTLEAMEQVLEFEFSSFLRLVNDKLIVHTTIEGHQVMEFPLDGNGLTVRSANTQKTVLVNDTRKDPSYVMGSLTSLSELDVPIVVDGKTIGVLNVEQNRVNAFNEDHKTLLETLASHVQTAVYRLEREKEIERIREQHISNLIKSFREMTNMVQHDLRSPLQAITNAVHILTKNPDNEKMKALLKDQVYYIDTILKDWERQTLTGSIKKSEVNIHRLFNLAIKASQVPKNIHVSLNVNEDLVFNLDLNSMMRVISNLIKNGIEAMPDGGELQLSAHVDNDILVIEINDTGKGIENEIIDQIFTPFFTTKPEGMGLGLAFVRQVIEEHEGKIEVESQINQGTKLIIRLP